MPQIFHRSTNTISKLSIFGALLAVVGLAAIAWEIYRSPWMTEASVAKDQPVPFSHEHHVGGLGIECRYCHTSVEEAPSAGIPATRTCMTCHSQIWTQTPVLEPLRESFRTGVPLRWVRVHDLPDFVAFDHSIHVAKGVACASCHGRIETMPLTWQVNTLHMQWCVGCHRERDRSRPPMAHLLDCATCHR